jgi:hypothetical protein
VIDGRNIEGIRILIEVGTEATVKDKQGKLLEDQVAAIKQDTRDGCVLGGRRQGYPRLVEREAEESWQWQLILRFVSALSTSSTTLPTTLTLDLWRWPSYLMA